MKKTFWVDARSQDKKIITAAIESGADGILISKGTSEEVKKLGNITTLAEDGDLKCGIDFDIIRITKKADEDRVVAHKGNIPVIIENNDWTIIPLENLISKTTNLIQTVSSPAEAKLALETMERGADGILLIPSSINDILQTAKIIQELSAEHFALETVQITDIMSVTMSDRCCVDTTSILPPGTGFLVGNSGKAMFLVHNENVSSPYCAARPFRVNAGAVHAYIRLPENRTKYLSELSSGDDVLAVDPQGNAFAVAVGRNKIERRPMLLITAKSADGKEVRLILQNAETIRLTTPKGQPASVTGLEKGDEVLAFFGEETGRHFGEAIDETIREK